MRKNINFEDNIFILNTKIRSISDLLLLDADPDLFLQKTIEDLTFISTTINLLLDNLASNKLLITRDEQIHNLNETIEVFIDVLSSMLRNPVSFSVNKYPMIEESIRAILLNCTNQHQLIDGFISEMDMNNIDQRVVSQEEMTELLKDLI